MPKPKFLKPPERPRISTTISAHSMAYLQRRATEAGDVIGRVLDAILKEHEKASGLAQ